MATFGQDSFTDSDTTLLHSHTPSGGGAWHRHISCAIDALVYGNRVVAISGEADYYHDGSPATAEYDVLADVVCLSVTGYAGVYARVDTGATFLGYGAGYDASNTRWYLWCVNGGGFSLLGTYTQVLSPTTTYQVKLQCRDAAKKLFVDGVERISSADNSIASAGKAGLYTVSGTSSTGLHVDNWLAMDPVVGGGGNFPYTFTFSFSERVFRQSLAGTLDFQPGVPFPQAFPILFGRNNLSWVTKKQLAGWLVLGGTQLRALIGFRVLGGVLSLSGVVTRPATFARVMTGVLVPSGQVIRQTGRLVVGVLGMSGNLPRGVYRTIQGNLGLSGTLAAPHLFYRIFTGVLGLAGHGEPMARKILRGSLGLVGTLSRRVRKTLGGVLTLTGTWSRQLTLHLLLGGVLGFNGQVYKHTQRLLTGSLLLSGLVVRRVRVTLGGVLSPAGDITRYTRKTVRGILGFNGRVNKGLGKVLGGVLGLSGNASKLSRRLLGGVLGLVGVATYAGFEIKLASTIRVDVVMTGTIRQDLTLKPGQRTDLGLASTIRER